MSLISINNLSFSYPGSEAKLFDNVTLQLDTAYKLGLIGRNGRGKTTFLNLLAGNLEYKGKLSATCTFEYFPFEIEDPDLEVLSLITGKIDEPDVELWQIQRECSLLEMDDEDILYRPFSTLSGGEAMKVMLICLFLKTNAFLLIDEPTNHLDIEAREVLGEYLAQKKGFILVSHDRGLLNTAIDHVLSINRASIELIKGNYDTWQENKNFKDSFELAQNNKLKKEIGRLEVAVRRTKGWSDKIEASKIGSHVGDRGFIGHKSAKMMKRAKALENRQKKAIEDKSDLLKDVEVPQRLKIFPLSHHASKLVIADDITIRYDQKTVFENLSFEILKNTRTALVGRNGSGKSSILTRIASKDLMVHAGSLRIPQDLVVSYVPQDSSFLTGAISTYADERGIDKSILMMNLDKLDFNVSQFKVPMESLSEGEKKKILIASSLSTPAHLYVWDEALNYIDILSRVQIENLILEHTLTLLFVEHDKDFLETVATDIIYLD
jgi:lincosamide and streptogramin A transport system ATP-binding/permease protein